MSKSDNLPDVCIIGAGLAGGLMAFELASKGVKVIILEAGPKHNLADRPRYMHERLYNEINPWRPNIPERDVYTSAGEIDYPLNEFRVKAVGGTTLHWGGLATRYHESDFQMKRYYGLAADWPISYADLEPYYGKAETALGVAGTDDNPFESYRSSAFPLPVFPFNHADRLFEKGCKSIGIKIHHVPWARNSIPYQGRPACAAFSTCQSHNICPISAQYTAETHINLAEKTGNAKIITDANVVRINADRSGKVRSVTYMTHDKKDHEQKAKIFVLAAHAIESTRLLLLSTSDTYPNGLANSSGLVGKYFMEHLGVAGIGKIKENVYPYRIGFHTAASHQFCNPKNRDEISGMKLTFRTNVRPLPSDIAIHSEAWGDDLAEEVRESFGHRVAVSAQIEQLPNFKNSITLDPLIKDYFGNPAPRISYAIDDYEKNSLIKGFERVTSILEAMGATAITGTGLPEKPAVAAHHMGTCRMGSNPDSSVVNRNLKAHDVDNLFIVGSSTFVTGGTLHPSLTIAALAIRAAEHIREIHSRTL